MEEWFAYPLTHPLASASGHRRKPRRVRGFFLIKQRWVPRTMGWIRWGGEGKTGTAPRKDIHWFANTAPPAPHAPQVKSVMGGGPYVMFGDGQLAASTPPPHTRPPFHLLRRFPPITRTQRKRRFEMICLFASFRFRPFPSNYFPTIFPPIQQNNAQQRSQTKIKILYDRRNP